MAITKIVRNSKENFLGGGMGVLIPFKPTPLKDSTKPSTNSQSEAPIPHEMYTKEISEQMVAQSEAGESSSTTDQEGGNCNG